MLRSCGDGAGIDRAISAGITAGGRASDPAVSIPGLPAARQMCYSTKIYVP